MAVLVDDKNGVAVYEEVAGVVVEVSCPDVKTLARADDEHPISKIDSPNKHKIKGKSRRIDITTFRSQ